MEIEKNLFIYDLSLFLKKEKVLVISDLHLGFEESLRKQGFLVPWFQFKEIKEKLEKIFSQIPKLNKIIINGDLKHEFGKIPKQEWGEVLALIDFLQQKCKKIILIKGNHDTILSPLAEKLNLKIEKTGVKIGKVFITHGHEIPETKKFKESKVVIIGHEHPAISLSDGAATETCKCFLKGKYKNKVLVVQPSFCLASEGADILKEKTLSPFLSQNLENFEVYALAEKPLYFGALKNLNRSI